MTIFGPRDWITLAFDQDAKLCERGVSFGWLNECAFNLERKAQGIYRGFELAGALFVSPALEREAVQRSLNNALVLRLPNQFGRYIDDRYVGEWINLDHIARDYQNINKSLR